ncbi:MAG: response regulator transcription factor [Ruminococcus sp.]|nr:response regulator transcription factor [Ruminococcus sp.]
MEKQTIAVIDDDQAIGDMLERVLVQEGYSVLRAYSGTEALLLLGQEKPDLVLLDLMLPGLSGEELLPKIRSIPVIVVSAKIDTANKVKLLLGGAVDYITKPFEISELLARITVALRSRPTGTAALLKSGGLTLDTESHIVTAEGQEVKLTRTEFAILKLLMINHGQAVAKLSILDRIAEDTPDCTESSLKMHISNLRRKLRQAGGREYIEAVWGIGFKLVDN